MASQRASNWSEQEIHSLSSAWQERDVQEILDGRKRNTSAYEKIASSMSNEGFQRMREQIQVGIHQSTCVLSKHKKKMVSFNVYIVKVWITGGCCFLNACNVHVEKYQKNVRSEDPCF